MKSQLLHTVWWDTSGEAAGEIWHWSLLGVTGKIEIYQYTLTSDARAEHIIIFVSGQTDEAWTARLVFGRFWKRNAIDRSRRDVIKPRRPGSRTPSKVLITKIAWFGTFKKSLIFRFERHPSTPSPSPEIVSRPYRGTSRRNFRLPSSFVVSILVLWFCLNMFLSVFLCVCRDKGSVWCFRLWRKWFRFGQRAEDIYGIGWDENDR